ncbi:CGNR zinc finger domain-containing protein [Spiractinospora alimapuensis]|uniref:CGNR zinc finger domain-containing protein n=1 Tax=Spiractinospora alimapuensis TaxID=2820884 RepID=UPI001F34C4A9|nr:CGNR zinc finger domain-containing protein [Spiractinospora alimapuensis]QVQ50110.1 CGNR zinc finger domain-containing protein [Spiractinospora alimapuensis]
MQFNHYGGNGAELASALANVVDHSPAGLAEALSAQRIRDPEPNEDQARELTAWCERLRPVFGERDQQHQIALVNALLVDGTTRVRIATHDGHPPHLHYQGEVDDLVSRVRAVTAGGLAVAVCGAGGHRLGRCERQGCEVTFIDTSRNGRRRFCSVTCANRVNVARHRSRHRS